MLADLRKSTLRSACHVALAGLLVLSAPGSGFAGSWATVTALPANSSVGTMLLLTDGTVMMENGGGPGWLRLTPDASGIYATGSWTTNPIADMSEARLYFASQILPNGKVWVLGGEYSGPGTPRTDTPTSEIYDPVANTWSPAATYPDQPGECGINTISYTGNTTSGSNVITGIPSTNNFYVGWSVTGNGIPAGTTITSIDTTTQVHVSNPATATASAVDLTWSGDRPACFGAVPTILLPGGTQILAGSLVDPSTQLYNIATNSWTPNSPKVYERSDEEGFALTSSPASIIVYDIFRSFALDSGYAEKYNPATSTWASISPADGTANGTLPVLSSDALGAEFGPTLRLQDGRILEVGANSLTALYAPGTPKGTWAAGPVITGTLSNTANPGGSPAPFGADDAPGAIFPNGHVLLAADSGPASVTSNADTTNGSATVTDIPSTALLQVGWGVVQANGNSDVIPANTTIASVDSATQVTLSNAATATALTSLKFGGTFSAPTQLFDFNPAGAGTIIPLAAGSPFDLSTTGAYTTRMVVLPTGQVLFGTGGSVAVYTPDGTASPTLRPVVNNITYNGGGKFTLTGRQLDGQSAGADYGDDVQMDSNYPILRLVNSAGKVFYCRSTNWSAGAVGTGPVIQTVNFTLPSGITAGNYSAIVSGAGISSVPVGIVITQAEVNGQ